MTSFILLKTVRDKVTSVKKPIQPQLETITAARGDMPAKNEKALFKQMRRKHRNIVQGQW